MKDYTDNSQGNKEVLIESNDDVNHAIKGHDIRYNQILAERKTRNQATFRNNYYLFRFICGAKNKRLTKSGRELGPAENRAPYCMRVLCKLGRATRERMLNYAVRKSRKQLVKFKVNNTVVFSRGY